MATPRRDILRRPDVPRRRSARQALAVIPASAGSNISPATDTAARRYSVDSNNSAASPDEMVIQRRGRRKSIVWSPDVESFKRESIFRDRTPGKSPTKALSHITLRSTPRKKLQLDDSDIEMVSPEEREKTLMANRFTGSLSSGLRGLSHEQLVKMIMDLVSMQEDNMMAPNDQLRDIILRKMPVADIQPLKERLAQIRQNVSASCVSSAKGESDYSRAYVHLDNFQKALREQGQTLLDSQHWAAVVQYVFAAWVITRELPEWKNQGMHSTTQKCYKHLTDFCLQGLRNGTFAPSTLNVYKDKLQTLLEDFSDINVCIQFINNGNGKA